MCDAMREHYSYFVAVSSLRSDFMCSYRSLLGMNLNILRAWIILKRHLLCWVVSCGRTTLAQCSQTSSGELGGFGDDDRLRCLHGTVDTTISCVCTCTPSSVLGTWSMGLVL